MSWLFGGGNCCSSRNINNVKGTGSEFDKLLLEGFSRVAGAGHVRSQPSSIRRRPLDGNFGLNAQFSPDHFEKKRQREVDTTKSVVMPVDPGAFNFTKVNEAEVIATVDCAKVFKPPDTSFFAGMYQAEEDKRDPVPATVLVCASPLATGHVLLVPRREELLPQALTSELMLYGLNLMTNSKRNDFRMVFNSLMGFASVNHFHFHGLYLDYCSLSTKRLPIEKVDRSVIAGSRTEGKTCVELLSESQWYSRGLVLTAGCAKGAGDQKSGSGPLPDLEALANLTGRIVEHLQQSNIPHNVLIAPYLGERRARKVEDVFLSEEEVKPSAVSPEVYIIPRQPEHKLRDAAGFNAAICEVSGMLVARDEQHFNDFDEKTLTEIFQEDVALSGKEFDDLICKVAWMVM